MTQPRRAIPTDAKAIWEVLKYAKFLHESYRDEKKQDEIKLACENKQFWVAEDSYGQIASVMMICRKDFDIPGCSKCFSIPILVTKPEYHRKGFAKTLIGEAKKQAGTKGDALFAHAENEISTALLKSEDFCLVPECRNKQGHQKYEWVREANERPR